MNKNLLTAIFIFSLIDACAQQSNDTLNPQKWSTHYQLTAIKQAHPSFSAAYTGANSL